ncbi:MAG: ROK family protein [Spirochaetaceae bacterium]
MARQIRQSLPAAASHIDALIAAGLLRTAGQRPSSGGRPADEYEINPPSLAAIGVEVHPNYILSVCCGVNGEIWDSVRTDIDAPRVRDGAYTEAVIAEAINGLHEKWSPKLVIHGAGVAVPGIVDCEKRLLVNAPNLFLKNYSFDCLAQKLSLPLFVDNEANAAAIGEYWTSSVPLSTSMVLISIREGVGAGILLAGQVVRGRSWRAGEFGHMAIRAGVRLCNCGRTGCWEQYVSERALIADLGENAIARLKDQVGDDNAPVAGVWAQYIESLAIGIENIAACINPDLVVISGSIAGLGDRLIEPLQRALAEVSFLTQGIRVSVSKHPDTASALGAGLMTFSGLLPGLGLKKPEMSNIYEERVTSPRNKGESHVG